MKETKILRIVTHWRSVNPIKIVAAQWYDICVEEIEYV